MRKLSIYFFVILIFLIPVLLSGQYDERQVLTQQAFQLLAQRQFGQAETLFQEILGRYPDDLNSIQQLLNIYYQTSQLDKAEMILTTHRRIIPQLTLLEHEIQLLILKGLPDQAWQKSMQVLQLSNNDQNRYRVLAAYFERRGFFENALSLYHHARDTYRNDDLFSLEIANAALNFRIYEQAIREYLRFLDKNPANIFFVNNQIKLILTEAPQLITLIGEYAASNYNPIVKELYAGALVSLKHYDDALNVYKLLPPEKLWAYAEQQYQAQNDAVAFPALNYLSQTTNDVIRKSDYLIRMAHIAIRKQWLSTADSLLNAVITDSLLMGSPNRNRTANNLLARRLKADLLLESGSNADQALSYLQEARSYARQAYDREEIDLEIARLHIALGRSDLVQAVLATVLDSKHSELRQYYTFLNELLHGEISVADSLMNDFIIKWPGSRHVNDAMYLMMFMLGLKGDQIRDFKSAYQAMQLRDDDAPRMLYEIYESSSDEEILILAIEWSLSLGNENYALQLLNHEWEDPLAKEYAPYLIMILIDDPEEVTRHAREFLKQNPGSIFSPSFRSMLSNSNPGRPSF